MDILSVSDITKHIKSAMEGDPILRSALVRGEISNFKRHSSGHCYFTLKDALSSIKCVLFRGKAQYLKFSPENGMKAVAEGYVTVFERDGAYQLYVNALFPEGAGELSVAFAQLKERLTQEGLFDAAHKKALPSFPRRIGIVTSATGAVLRDIFTVAKRRNPQVALFLYPVQVQGGEAAAQIAAAVRFFNVRYPVDALIVGRGGGSMEDLWPFNEELVVRAVFASEIPVVSAVGHETDYTLTDFAADVRAATPSQAAELLVPDALELKRYVASLAAHLQTRARRLLNEKYTRLEVCRQNKSFRRPQLALDGKKQLLDYLAERLERENERVLLAKKHQLGVLLEKLRMLSPMDVLSRGYGMVKTEAGVAHSVRQIQKGAGVEVVLSDGRFDAIVTSVKKEQIKDGL